MKNVHKNLTTLLLCCSLGAFADESQYFHTSQFFPASVQSPTASDLGSVEQANHYYPTGVLLAKSTNPGLQRYKYNGKAAIKRGQWQKRMQIVKREQTRPQVKAAIKILC